MFTSIRDSLATAQTRLSSLRSPFRIIIVAALVIFATFLLYWVVDKILVFFVARSYVDEVSEVFDLNKNLATALVWVAFAAIIICTR
jgi:hypothetical protein